MFVPGALIIRGGTNRGVVPNREGASPTREGATPTREDAACGDFLTGALCRATDLPTPDLCIDACTGRLAFAFAFLFGFFCFAMSFATCLSASLGTPCTTYSPSASLERVATSGMLLMYFSRLEKPISW